MIADGKQIMVQLQDQQAAIDEEFVDYYVDLGLLVREGEAVALRSNLCAEPDKLNGGLTFWNPNTAPYSRHTFQSNWYRVMQYEAFWLQHGSTGSPGAWNGWSEYDAMQSRYRASIGRDRCRSCGQKLVGRAYIETGQCFICQSQTKQDDAWERVLGGMQREIDRRTNAELLALPSAAAASLLETPTATVSHGAMHHIPNRDCRHCRWEMREVVAARFRSAKPTVEVKGSVSPHFYRLREDAEARVWLRAGDGAVVYATGFEDEWQVSGSNAELLHACIEASIYTDAEGGERIAWPEVWAQYDAAMEAAKAI